jgi:hypothetical protein
VKAYQTFVMAAMIVGSSATAFAQSTPSASTSEAAVNLRAQVRTMERVFSSAIQNGVDQIGRKMNEAVPGLRIFAGMPHAHGYRVDNFGWFFDVEVPEVQTATVQLYQELQRDPRRPSPGERPVGNTVNGAVELSVPVNFDPSREYRLAIRNALIDAMLDFGQLPLMPGEELTVGARAADGPGPGLESSDTVTLILRISGADLTAFRQGKITRADAKARVRIKEDAR